MGGFRQVTRLAYGMCFRPVLFDAGVYLLHINMSNKTKPTLQDE